MFNPKTIGKDDREMKSLTGLSLKEFEKLLLEFIKFFPFKVPRGKEPVLKTNRDKLFFILFYLKCYPTIDVAAAIYGVNRSQISRWYNQLKPVLEQALGKVLVLAERHVKNSVEFRKLFPKLKEAFIDGTERAINRPKKNQKDYYSGKKHLHTVENLLLSDKRKEVLILTKTVSGKNHDYGLFKKGDINIPSDVKVWLDLGFLGIGKDFPQVDYEMPHKKPKGGELTQEQKDENKEISKVRVKVEHAIAGIKRYNSVTQKYRNRGTRKADEFMLLAVGLWNFHLKYAYLTVKKPAVTEQSRSVKARKI